MNISRNLFIGFALVISLAVVVGIVGAEGMKKLRQAERRMYENQVVGLEYLNKATEALKQARLQCNKVIISSFHNDRKSAEDSKELFEKGVSDFDYWMAKTREVATVDELDRFHSVITVLFKEVYVPNAEKIIRATLDDMPDHNNKLLINLMLVPVVDAAGQMEKLIAGMTDLTSALAKRASESNERITRLLIISQYVMLGAAVIVAIVVTLYVAKNIAAAYRTIDEQNRMILSGVHYASKIQKNLLPVDHVFREAFSEHSVIWNPRDILGGDIYWQKNFDGGSVLCVCDCTGHGTPGALLTMLVVSALESLVQADNYRSPARLLRLLDQRLASLLNINAPADCREYAGCLNFKDGCDIAVLFIDHNGSVSISSANIRVFVCDGARVRQIKGQKIQIGEGVLHSDEDVHVVVIPHDPDNKFYIATDGLYDQIGGERSRPFGYTRFQQLILENHHESQAVITERIWAAFESYRGREARRDDVELIAFTV